jgi:hypothetical protein
MMTAMLKQVEVQQYLQEKHNGLDTLMNRFMIPITTFKYNENIKMKNKKLDEMHAKLCQDIYHLLSQCDSIIATSILNQQDDGGNTILIHEASTCSFTNKG